MSRRKKSVTLAKFLCLALIIGVIAMGVVYAFTGVTVYSCENYDAVTALDSNSAIVTVSGVSEKNGRLSFTLAAPAAVLKIKFDFAVNDWKDEGIRMMILDTTEMTTNGTFDKVKIYIGDGTNEYYVGSMADVGTITNWEVPYSDLEDVLTDSANVYLILKTTNEGNLVNAFSAEEQEIAVEFTRGGGYQTATALIASGIISIIGTLKKAISGLVSAFGAFITALVTNEVIIILAVGIALVAVFFLFGPKKGYRRVFI